MKKNNYKSNLYENLMHGDLERVITKKIHIDEFKSKIGDDKDICVISFRTASKESANDLMNFIQKSTPSIIDVDMSPGALNDKKYLVYVEIPRNEDLYNNILELVNEVKNLSGSDIEEWKFKFFVEDIYHSLTIDNLQNTVPNSDKAYEDMIYQRELKSIKESSGVKIYGNSIKDKELFSIQQQAGIK